MFDLDKWQEILYTLTHNKLRTFLTALGVFWGIMMLVLLLGSGRGLENGVLYNFRGFAVNSIYMWPQETTLAYKGLKAGRYYHFKNADIDALVNNVEGIDKMAPRVQLGGWRDGNNVSRKNVSGNFQVMGDYPEFKYVQSLEISKGRYLNELDLEEERKVCVIGDQVLAELFPEEAPIGKYLKIQGVYFKVIGVFNSVKNTGHDADRDARTIFIPFTTFQRAFNFNDRLGWFSFTVKEGHKSIDVENEAKRVLMDRHTISPEDDRAIGSFNTEDKAKQFTGLFSGIKWFIWIVGLGTLFAGVVGVSNIMLIVVNERTKEIGIRKAMGATPFSIIAMILQESVFLTMFAGYFGLVVGVGILELINKMMLEFDAQSGFFREPSIQFETAITATSILVIAGALAGLMPAIKAVNINPITALRTE